VDQRPTLADRFEADRQHLRAVALRILGDPHEADDAVQEAWLRLSTTDASTIDNLTGWLTTVVSRICLNVLRDRKRQPTAPLDEAAVVDRSSARAVGTPEDQAVLADALGGALLVVLDRLTPAERIALVLHDMFSLSFGEVGGILDRSPEACRQLASRARRRVRQAQDPATDPRRQRETVEAFLTAATSGDFAALLAILSPDAELVADPAAVAMGAPAGLASSDEVATMFSGRAKGARTALLDGLAGLVWAQGGTPRVAFDFTVEAGRVTRIEMTADPEVLGEIDLEVLGRTRGR
jgi:RNA polymerase sigma factor (sigma-70 family)